MARNKLKFRCKALTIACTDRRRSERFYTSVLGATAVKTPDDIGCPWFRLGSFVFTLMPNAARPTPAAFPDHAMFLPWLEVDDLAAARKRFARAKVTVVQSHPESMVIADPDGLLIEVWQTTDEGAQPG
ncbi:MAG TPA: VOC family protein [Gemmataceae bacterium]|nr:VOC family protein [Gemmataceae bacterium]